MGECGTHVDCFIDPKIKTRKILDTLGYSLEYIEMGTIENSDNIAWLVL